MMEDLYYLTGKLLNVNPVNEGIGKQIAKQNVQYNPKLKSLPPELPPTHAHAHAYAHARVHACGRAVRPSTSSLVTNCIGQGLVHGGGDCDYIGKGMRSPKDWLI